MQKEERNMGYLAQAKTLGGIGSVLVLLSIIPCAGVGFGLVGLVLILVAIKYISDILADKSVFNNMFISVVLAVIGVVVGFVIAAATLFSFFRGFTTPPDPSIFTGSRFFSFFTTILLAIVPIWIFCIVSAIFLKRSYNTISSKLNISMFSTAALLYLIGAALTIILIGFIIIFIAGILQAIAFFSMPEEAKQPSKL